MFDYLRDPEEIYRRSFAIVRAETNLPDWPTDIAAIARRLTHACGMPDIVADLAWSVDAASAGRAALVGELHLLVGRNSWMRHWAMSPETE